MNDLSEFALLSDFQEANPNIVRNLDSLRWMVRHREKNGLREARAVVKRQGRWYVHAGNFTNWMLGDSVDRRHAA